jgi:hypothetical protein
MDENWTKTFKAAEDLDTLQYHAIALSDNKLANNGGEAFGILLTKPKSGENGTIAYMGEIPYRAGGAITIGKLITVTTSGWFVTAGSGFYSIGRATATVTSGDIGIGLFNFQMPVYANTSDFIGTS